MTISTSVSRIDYVGNGTTTAFAVPFAFFDATEIRVISRVISTGVETVQVLNTNYTVSGGNGSTGTVTAVVAPASTVQWSILRNTRRTQDVDYQPNDPFPAETHERALDRIVAVLQEVERDALRSIRAAETDSTASLTLPTQGERASRILGFDANGNPVPVIPNGGNLSVTPYAQGILSAGNAATARGVLGSTAIGDALFIVATAAAARALLGATSTGGALFTAADAAAARTAIGATATGSSVVTAADGPAGRTALNAMAVLTTGTGQQGSVVALNSGSGSSLTAPAGGRWVAIWYGVTVATGAVTGVPEVGEVNGGATLKTGSAGIAYYGWAFRVVT